MCTSFAQVIELFVAKALMPLWKKPTNSGPLNVSTGPTEQPGTNSSCPVQAWRMAALCGKVSQNAACVSVVYVFARDIFVSICANEAKNGQK